MQVFPLSRFHHDGWACADIGFEFVNPAPEALGPRATNRFHLYRGACILELTGRGLELDAWCLGLDATRDFLYQLGA